jgi:hypothetical protein
MLQHATNDEGDIDGGGDADSAECGDESGTGTNGLILNGRSNRSTPSLLQVLALQQERAAQQSRLSEAMAGLLRLEAGLKAARDQAEAFESASQMVRRTLKHSHAAGRHTGHRCS